MLDKDGVNIPGSPAGETQVDPSKPGDSFVLPDGRNVKEVIEENKRKSDELKAMKAEKEEIEEELEGLRDKAKKTPDDRERISELEDQKDDIKTQLRSALNDPANKLLVELIREVSSEVSETKLSKRELEASFDRQEEFLSETAKKEKITVKELRKKLNQYAGPYMNKSPDVQAKMAYRDLQRFSKLEESETLAEREKKERDYVEPDNSTGAGIQPHKKRFSPSESREESLAALAGM